MKKVTDCQGKTRVTVVWMISLVGLFILLSVARPGYAQEPSSQDTELMLQKLKQRDALIDDLNRRVKLLESQQGTPETQQQSPGTAVVPAGKAQAPDKSPAAESAQQAQTAAKPQSQAKGKSSAGGFEVDELAAERALDRTLVETGALLLPFRQLEIQPFVTYTRREVDFPVLVTNNNGQLIGVRTGDVRRNEFDTGFIIRAGLPFESQLELRLPARIVDQTTVVPSGVANLSETSNTGAALGDISVGFAKTLLHESDWIPDLVGRFTWDSDSGKIVENSVPMGTGFNEFRVSLTALKRQDPLAFTGRFDYQTSLEKNGIDPGDQYSLSLGASLAASPYTSLSLGFQQTWRQKSRISNAVIAGSDEAQSVISFGVTTIVTRRLFLTVAGGIGLTDASPDYFINVSLPLRISY